MNLLLFNDPFVTRRIAFDSEQGRHLRDVLKVTPGAMVYVGFLGGERALCRVEAVTADDCQLRVERTEASPALLPLTLCIALPRPHSARKLLYDAAMMGVGELVFFSAERGEPSYRESRLWQTDEWRERIQVGLEQSFSTLPPKVTHLENLQAAVAFTNDRKCAVLDNYEATQELTQWLLSVRGDAPERWALFIGPERGWTNTERDVMRTQSIPLVHMGSRVMRVESAALAATAVLSGICGCWT